MADMRASAIADHADLTECPRTATGGTARRIAQARNPYEAAAAAAAAAVAAAELAGVTLFCVTVTRDLAGL